MIDGVSSAIKSPAVRILIGVTVLFAGAWIVIGLVSLRVDLQADLWGVVKTQFAILAGIVIVLANEYVRKLGDLETAERPKTVPILPVLARLSSLTAGISLVIYIIWLWVDFGSSNDALLKTMLTLLTIGLCGTYSGAVSLVRVDRVYRMILWLVYLLVAVIAVEIADYLWLEVAELSESDAGGLFVRIAVVIAITTAAYIPVAIFILDWTKREKSPIGAIVALVAYFLIGIGGFTIGVWLLWERLDAGPLRFVLGAAMLLSMATVGLVLWHQYRRITLELSLQGLAQPNIPPPPRSQTPPVQSWPNIPPPPRSQTPPVQSLPNIPSPPQPQTPPVQSTPNIPSPRQVVTNSTQCPGCGRTVSPSASFCVSCGMKLPWRP